VVKSNVGLSLGIREELGMTLCPFSSKNFKNNERNSSLFMQITPEKEWGFLPMIVS
jgi:hypothetical protein